MLFGPDSLVKYIKFKNSLWFRIRESYRELQLHQKSTRKISHGTRESVYASKSGKILYGDYFPRVVIAYAKRDFEGTFHRYKLTTLPISKELTLQPHDPRHLGRARLTGVERAASRELAIPRAASIAWLVPSREAVVKLLRAYISASVMSTGKSKTQRCTLPISDSGRKLCIETGENA